MARKTCSWRQFRARTSAEGGAVSVEFALIAPLLISLLFGIMCFGYFFAIATSLQQLASEGARVSVQGLTREQRVTLAEGVIEKGSTRFPLLVAESIGHEIDVPDVSEPYIQIDLTYDLVGSVLDLANGLFGLDLSTITRSAYLVY